MKWDFAIGNPPYQQETENISLTNGQLRSKSVFQARPLPTVFQWLLKT